MKFLFAAQGYPGVPGTVSGSGIGTYVRELTLGLTARGHHCHVLVWSCDGRSGETVVEGVTIHFIPRKHWPVLERWWPDSRNERNRSRVAARLDHRYEFDWIEIQSDEGVDHRIQEQFGDRVILRVHTTLLQMCHCKEIRPNRLTETWLNREKQSLLMAHKIVVSSPNHAAELIRLFPGIATPRLVTLGYGSPATPQLRNGSARQRFIVVGSFDRRKGTDRLLAVATAYAEQFGPCELRLVSQSPESILAEEFRLGPPYPLGVSIQYLTHLSAAELADEYRLATAYLHLARYESFGYPLIEAASHGTPIVATSTGIAPNLLVGSLDKLLIDGEDPSDCVRAMALAARDRWELGRRLYQSYSTGFSRDHMTNHYLELLEEWRAATIGMQPVPASTSRLSDSRVQDM